jgi:hypothetical protein
MATVAHYKREFPKQQAPTFGSFWMFAEVDFATWPCAQNDIFQLFKLKDQWIVRESYYKITTGSALGSDWELGINGGTEIADVSTTTTAADWVAGTITSAAPRLVGADEYVTVQCTDAAETAGKIQVMIEVIAAPDNCEPVDANIDD